MPSYPETVYVMQSSEWVKIGISNNLPLRASDLKAEIVTAYEIGEDARLVECIACRLLAADLDSGYEYFRCTTDEAVGAVETAIVMAWRGDFSALPWLKDVPRRYRQWARLARPRNAHRPFTPQFDEHVLAFWKYRQSCPISEAIEGVGKRYGIKVSRQTVYNQTVGPLSGDRK